jgi:hypothetical protein
MNAPVAPARRAQATSPSSRRLLRQLAGQVGLSQIAHRSGSALKKAHNRRPDNRTKLTEARTLSRSVGTNVSCAFANNSSILGLVK